MRPLPARLARFPTARSRGSGSGAGTTATIAVTLTFAINTAKAPDPA